MCPQDPKNTAPASSIPLDNKNVSLDRFAFAACAMKDTVPMLDDSFRWTHHVLNRRPDNSRKRPRWLRWRYMRSMFSPALLVQISYSWKLVQVFVFAHPLKITSKIKEVGYYSYQDISFNKVSLCDRADIWTSFISTCSFFREKWLSLGSTENVLARAHFLQVHCFGEKSNTISSGSLGKPSMHSSVSLKLPKQRGEALFYRTPDFVWLFGFVCKTIRGLPERPLMIVDSYCGVLTRRWRNDFWNLAPVSNEWA